MTRPGKPPSASGENSSGGGEAEFLQVLYQGGELLAAGKVIEAKDYLERAYQMRPRNEKSQNLLGLTYFKLGLFDRAAEIYETLVQENPADPTLRVNLGLVYLKSNALARAIREFETATDLAPEHMRAHNYLGIALAQAGEYGRARDHFLLSGSEQMVEKMNRAIAGESVPAQQMAPTPTPAPATPVPLGVPRRVETPPPPAAAPARAAPLPRDQEPEPWIISEPPALTLPTRLNGSEHPPFTHRTQPEAAAVPADAAAADGKMELVGDVVVEAPDAPAAPLTPSEVVREIELSGRDLSEGGTAGVQPSAAREGTPDDQFDASFAEPVPVPVPLAPEAPPAVEHAEEIVGVAPGMEGAGVGVGEGAGPPEGVPDFAEGQPAELPPEPLRVEGPAKGESAPVPDLPIAALAPSVAMFADGRPGPFLIEPDAVAVVVQGEILTRVVGLVAQSGQLELAPQNRRYRGRTSDMPFGEGEAQLMRVSGKGRLVVQVPGRTLVSVELDDESAYLLESVVFAFEEPLAFENGRVASDEAPDLDLVRLRGKGRVLLSLPGALRSMEVKEQEPVTMPLANLVGWHGNLSPKVVALARDRSGKPGRAGLELSGEGYALLSVGSG